MTPQTLFEKIWNQHVVIQEKNSPAILYIDLHLIHEVTSPQAFTGLRERDIKVHRPDKTIATLDHAIPTIPVSSVKHERLNYADEQSKKQIKQLEENCKEFGIQLYGLNSNNQGIVHVISPEFGYTQPGMTIVCGDSHTATHGAFGALAFGIGTSEVEHVLATQCLLQDKPKTCQVKIDGRLSDGVSAKDIILALIEKIGIGGGTGYVLEYTGTAIKNLSMEERMTICNMSIEAGARAGMIAPDEMTFEYLADKEFSPTGKDWDNALKKWKQLPSDENARFDKYIEMDASLIEPMITYGTNPGMGVPIDKPIPLLHDISDENQKLMIRKALDYMGLPEGKPVLNHPVDVVFIGSCTNGRISDLRAAAKIMKGKKIADNVRVLVVPGSQNVKSQAEAEGLDKIFLEAGAEWREPGCSMCIAMNGDQLEPGQYAVSTSNRNFEGRQGKGSRTFLASPITAAAAALHGKVVDVRSLIDK